MLGYKYNYEKKTSFLFSYLQQNLWVLLLTLAWVILLQGKMSHVYNDRITYKMKLLKFEEKVLLYSLQRFYYTILLYVCNHTSLFVNEKGSRSCVVTNVDQKVISHHEVIRFQLVSLCYFFIFTTRKHVAIRSNAERLKLFTVKIHQLKACLN